jgi:hypothetical protein
VGSATLTIDFNSDGGVPDMASPPDLALGPDLAPMCRPVGAPCAVNTDCCSLTCNIFFATCN